LGKVKKYNWVIGEEFPLVDDHSIVKLEIIERYIEIYLTVLTQSHVIDSLKLTVVDGFAGGGLYSGGIKGSPLRIYESIQKTQKLINYERKNKNYLLLARSWQSSYILKIFATIREVKRYRARYYDPTTQRFLSQDPIGFASGDFNFYRYVGNSPGNFVDPSGKSALTWISLSIGAYLTWKSYDDLVKDSQKYCTDTNLTGLDYSKKYYENMNKFLPFYQNRAKSSWKNQFGNKGRGLGGVPPGR